MQLKVGDVIRVWDRRTKPPKDKLHICVSVEKNFFFRINSRPLFPPHMLLRADEASFLHHDSYVELQQLVRHYEYDIREADFLGRLNETQIRRLRISVQTCGALSDDIKDLVLENLDRY